MQQQMTLAEGIRRLGVVAPVRLDAALEIIARTEVLPVARSRTPHSKAKAALAVNRRAGYPVFTEGRLPWGNTVQWGRRFLPTLDSPKHPKYPNVVAGSYGVYRAVEASQARVGIAVAREVDRLMEKCLG